MAKFDSAERVNSIELNIEPMDVMTGYQNKRMHMYYKLLWRKHWIVVP